MAVRGPTISKRSWIPLSVIAIGLAGVWTVGILVGAEWRQSTPNRITPATLPETGGPRSGYPAPGFAVPGLAGGQVTLAQYVGHPRVVSFFASWCESCWNDIATLQRAYSRYHDQGLVILGVGVQDTVGSLRYGRTPHRACRGRRSAYRLREARGRPAWYRPRAAPLAHAGVGSRTGPGLHKFMTMCSLGSIARRCPFAPLM
jgi:hypothetical protein